MLHRAAAARVALLNCWPALAPRGGPEPGPAAAWRVCNAATDTNIVGPRYWAGAPCLTAALNVRAV